MTNKLDNLFSQQRLRLRRVLSCELAARVVAALAGAFWVGLCLDWFFEPSPGVRQAAMIASAFGLFVWLARTVVEPLLRPITNEQIAALIEARWPEVGDSLLTAVNLRERKTEGQDPHLAEQTLERATGHLERIGDPKIVLSTRAQNWTSLAVLGVVTVVGFCIANSEAATTFASRLALSPEPWPRRVVLRLEGFEQASDGVWRRKVARGDAVKITVRADLRDGHVSPETVRLDYSFDQGPRGRGFLSKIGKPTTQPYESQLFTHAFDEVRTNLRMRLRGGDARLGPFEVQVAARPVVTQAEIVVTPPEYLGRGDWTRSVSAVGDIPEGSSARLLVKSSKPLRSAKATWTTADAPAPIDVTLQPGADELRVELPPLDRDGVLRLELIDTDGIGSAEPHPIPLSVVPDSPPRVSLQLAGVGAAITPNAAIDYAVLLEDDHGIDQAAVSLIIDESESTDREFPPPEQSPLEISGTIDLMTERFEAGLDSGRLQPGQKLVIEASASDHFNLREEPRATTSQRYTLELVSTDQFLARIEERELNLRRAFELTTSDMHRLERMLAESSLAEGDQSPLLFARLVDDAGKVIEETLAAGEAFAGIQNELIHNRIDNSDLLDRIGEGIVKPLLALGERRLPELREAIRELKDQQGGGEGASKLALAAAEEMERVLQKMKALEDYNEVLAMLRQVIDEQQRVRRETERTRRTQVRRSLLE